MAIYMTLLRYTPEGMKAALAAGMTSRKAMHDTVISAAGGTTLGYYLVGDADWDVASLVEYPETLTNANAARLMAGFKAGGAIEGRVQPVIATA